MKSLNLPIEGVGDIGQGSHGKVTILPTLVINNQEKQRELTRWCKHYSGVLDLNVDEKLLYHIFSAFGVIHINHDAFGEPNVAMKEATAATIPWLIELVVQQCWVPPSNQLYKVNVYWAVFKARKEFGVGAIICDANGLVVVALSKKIHAALGPLEVEAKAFESGLQFAKEVGLQEFILEGDSLNVVRALQGLLLPSVSVMPIIYRIQSSTYNVRKVLFSHVCRK
nr:hypothetical protein CFP56_60444 [Quercus suber]